MKSRGFTLLEVITAIFILTVGVGGAFSLIHQTLSVASLSELKLTGSYLAQEGMEIVRNIRDSNWLEQRTSPSTSWDNGLTGCQFPMCCEGDYDDTSLISLLSCNYDDLRYINIDANDFYSYSTDIPNTPTKFKRKILIEPEAGKIKVTVEVIWEERGRSHNVKVLGYLTNWYGQ